MMYSEVVMRVASAYLTNCWAIYMATLSYVVLYKPYVHLPFSGNITGVGKKNEACILCMRLCACDEALTSACFNAPNYYTPI